ncbi:unnamed protein product [[Actinomadura] parvosata subsp. kistnae]|uniref:hypothetical protein n=1 Tax=[Actinomadura] parvosata TaxID=1955412 RepID=UPI000D28A002|nr:unnamed protein product [Actinomadura parvosata subsp. kistnae]
MERRPAGPQQQANAVPDLPGGKVGPLGYAYRTKCERVAEPPGLDCDDVEWRVVTTAGKTYRLPQALARNDDGHDAPVALSRDGRKLAYYSRDAQAHVVRDMLTGAEVAAPPMPQDKIGTGSMLVVSDDGRYLVFDPREGSKYPGVLIDTSTGKRTTINGRYEPVAIKDGVVELIRYIKTDLWFMPVTGGGKPVRFDGTFVAPSEPAPDQRTVVAFDHGKYGRNTRPVLTVLDVSTGRAVREITVTGLSADRGYLTPTIWRDATEVEVKFDGKRGWELYALNVTTGKARLLKRYDTKLSNLTLPGEAAGIGL